MANSVMYARLKPYNRIRGHILRRYSLAGVRFYEGRWFKVPETFAQKLALIHQRHGNEDSPLAFDIATRSQAENIEHREKLRLEAEQRKVENASVIGATEVRGANVRGSLTTDDLPSSGDNRELGLSMTNTRPELSDAADSAGIDTSGMTTKRQILTALEEYAKG